MNRIRNALIVGGKGYIGSNLNKYLTSKGIEIFTLDKGDGFPAEQLSVLKEIDYIVHLAAYPGVAACKQNLQAATHDNISSAFRVFMVAHNIGIPVIFSSSQAAKFPEHSLYGTIKRMIEYEAMRYNYLNGDLRILRFTNVFGGENFLTRKLTVIPQIVRSINYGRPFKVNGDGSQTRDFIHVNDICRAIYKCMLHEDRILEPVDIGTGKGTSVLEIVERFKKKFDFVFTNDLKSDIIGPSESTADIKAAKELFDFEYKIELSDWIDSLEIEK